jgi:hypothetical protein
MLEPMLGDNEIGADWPIVGGLPALQRGAVLLAVVLLVLHAIPYGTLLVYPVKLAGAFLHEAGHGVVAMATGGEVLDFRVGWQGTGRSRVVGGAGLPVALAGYLTTMIAGVLVVWVAGRPSRATSTLLAVGVLVLAATIGLPLGREPTVPLLGLGLGGSLVGLGRYYDRTGRSGAKVTFGGVLAIIGALLYAGMFGSFATLFLGVAVGGTFIGLAALASQGFARILAILSGLGWCLAPLYEVKPLLFGPLYGGYGHSDTAALAQQADVSMALGALIWIAIALTALLAAIGGLIEPEET